MLKDEAFAKIRLGMEQQIHFFIKQGIDSIDLSILKGKTKYNKA